MMMIYNPYAGVDWSNVQKVLSCSHVHSNWSYPSLIDNCEKLYGYGMRHFPFTNYYPSKPTYPLGDYWHDAPDDAIGSPSAEHHNFSDLHQSVHIISLGSFFESGSPTGQEPLGVQRPWRDAFADMIDQLQYPDGGGIIVAHPNWSRDKSPLPDEAILQFLDFDTERVLGIEIFTSRNDGSGWSLNVWDSLLATGRRVFGFAVIDHPGSSSMDWGRSVLLVPDATEHDCLKAYRQGHFYAAMHGQTVEIESIEADDQSVSVSVTEASEIRFITNRGRVLTINNTTSATYPVTGQDVYVRVEVVKGDEHLLTQAVIYKDQEIIRKERMKRVFMLL